MLRQPPKPSLADALWAKLTPEAKTQPEGNIQYVLDGGSLLHRVPWPRGDAANGDADLLVVKTAVESAIKNSMVLVGDGTDLPVLLCYQKVDVASFFDLRQRQTRDVPKSGI